MTFWSIARPQGVREQHSVIQKLLSASCALATLFAAALADEEGVRSAARDGHACRGAPLPVFRPSAKLDMEQLDKSGSPIRQK